MYVICQASMTPAASNQQQQKTTTTVKVFIQDLNFSILAYQNVAGMLGEHSLSSFLHCT